MKSLLVFLFLATGANAQNRIPENQDQAQVFRVRGFEIKPCMGPYCDPTERMSASQNAWTRADDICRPTRAARVTQWTFSNRMSEVEAGFICSLD